MKCDLPIVNVGPKDYFDAFFSCVTVTSVTVRSNHRANKYAEKQIALYEETYLFKIVFNSL